MNRPLIAFVFLLLAGCVNLPELRKPAPDLPAAWSSSPAPEPAAEGHVASPSPPGRRWPEGPDEGKRPGESDKATAPDAVQLKADLTLPPDWWQLYADPALNALVAEVLANNTDLRLAAARIEEVRGNLGLARADRYPAVDAQAGAGRSRNTEAGRNPPPATGGPIANNLHVGLVAGYEVDLWGRLREADAAVRAELLASQYGREVVRRSLIDQAVRGWLGLRALDARLDLARQTLDNRREALALHKLRLDAGLTSELTVRQAEAETAAVEADLAQLTQAIRLQEHALAILAGRSPRQLTEGPLPRGSALPTEPPAVPSGLPSDLLVRRPDIRQAEQQLAAADARIAQVRAAIYPRLSLSANLGSESKALADLFSGPATVWGLAANLTQALYNAGRTEAAMQAAAARREQALLGYEQTVRQAFREVLDALVAHRQARLLTEAEASRATALRRAIELADLRYRNGVSNYLEVLDAQRSLYQTEQGRIEAHRARLTAVADLIGALGGGWREPKPSALNAEK